MSFPEKKFKKAFEKSGQPEPLEREAGGWARWGYAERDSELRHIQDIMNEADAPLKSLPAWKAGFNAAQKEFKRLLAEQREKAEKDLEKYGISSFIYQIAKGKLELLSVLEERLK